MFAGGLAALLAIGAAVVVGRRPEAKGAHEVEIEGFAYAPARVTAREGETVVWVNRDVVPHTVTARDGSWDSGEIPPGGEWRLVLPAAGTADYLCTLHPTMVGTLVTG